jgi:hypothetical protein
MDADFAGLVEKVNNFYKDGIFVGDKGVEYLHGLF